MTFIKVYIVCYSDGENYWHGKRVYIKKKNCLQEIINFGYVKDKNTEEFIRYNEDDRYTYYAKIEELELME